MTSNFAHVPWLKEKSEKLVAQCGAKILVYEFIVDENDDEAMRAWARHFREHYCLDRKLDRLRGGTRMTREQYLTNMAFPDASSDFGPATRSGDFAEILISDLLEGLLSYWVPRTRYATKMVRNESPKGTDIIGFKIVSGNLERPSKRDTLIAFESKAQLTGTRPKPRLQDAVTDSEKDIDKFRLAESLNAIKRRFDDLDKEDEVLKIERFQDPLGKPFVQLSGAAAVFCSTLYDPAQIQASTDSSQHTNAANLSLIVVHAKQLMNLVHTLYQRAANEA